MKITAIVGYFTFSQATPVLVEAERAIDDTNRLWHPAAFFPEPDELNPVVGLEGAKEVAHDFEVEVSAAAIEKDGAA